MKEYALLAFILTFAFSSVIHTGRVERYDNGLSFSEEGSPLESSCYSTNWAIGTATSSSTYRQIWIFPSSKTENGRQYLEIANVLGGSTKEIKLDWREPNGKEWQSLKLYFLRVLPISIPLQTGGENVSYMFSIRSISYGNIAFKHRVTICSDPQEER